MVHRRQSVTSAKRSLLCHSFYPRVTLPGNDGGSPFMRLAFLLLPFIFHSFTMNVYTRSTWHAMDHGRANRFIEQTSRAITFTLHVCTQSAA